MVHLYSNPKGPLSRMKAIQHLSGKSPSLTQSPTTGYTLFAKEGSTFQQVPHVNKGFGLEIR